MYSQRMNEKKQLKTDGNNNNLFYVYSQRLNEKKQVKTERLLLPSVSTDGPKTLLNMALAA